MVGVAGSAVGRLRRVLTAMLVVLLAASLAGCAKVTDAADPTGRPFNTVPTVAVTPAPSVTSPVPMPSITAAPLPIPTFTGASGPLGVVQVNQTYTTPSGLSFTVQQANTTWLGATPSWAYWPNGLIRVVGLRVSVDERQAKAVGTTFPRLPAQLFPIVLSTLDNRHPADCFTISSNESFVLDALGGDVAFVMDDTAGVGEGWIMCGTMGAQDQYFGGGYVINIIPPTGTTADGTKVYAPQYQMAVTP